MEKNSPFWELVLERNFIEIISVLIKEIFELFKQLFFKAKRKQKFSINKPTYLREKLIGRKKELRKLNKICRHQHCVWLSAPGGYGKSTLASAYAKKYRWRYSQIYWISWKGNIVKTLTDENNFFLDNPQELNKYNSILFFFNEQVSKRSLLIIDGLDNYDSSTIQKLEKFKCKILITSRTNGENHTKYNLDLLKPKECYRLFYEFSHIKLSKEQFNKVLDTTAQHPLTIRLLAKYACTHTVEKLFEDLIDNDVKNIKFKIEIEDGEPSCKIITYLTEIYKITFEDRKKNILINLSLLPNNDIKICLLEKIINKDIRDELAELKKLGWLISRTKNTIYLHPMLAVAIQQNCIDNKVPRAVYTNMIENIIRLTTISSDAFDDLNELAQYIPYCESITKLYKWRDLKLVKLLCNLSYLQYSVYDDTKSARENANSAFNILEPKYKKNSGNENIVILFTCLLDYMAEFCYKDNFSDAIEKAEKSLAIKKETYKSELEILKSYSNLMLFYHLASHKDYLNKMDNVLADYKDILKNYKRVQVNFYNHYSFLLVGNEKYEDACRCLEYAKKILIENNATNHYMYSQIISSLGASYGYLFIEYKNKGIKAWENYKRQALKCMYESYNIKKRNLATHNSSMAITLHNLAYTWSEAGYNLRGAFYEYRALKIRKRYPEEEVYLASSYLRLGIIFIKIHEKNKIFIHGTLKKTSFKYLKKALTIYEKLRNKSNDKNSYIKEINDCYKHINKINKEDSISI